MSFFRRKRKSNAEASNTLNQKKFDLVKLNDMAALSSGKSFWHTKAVGSVHSIMMTDGPHGLRKQDTTHGDQLGIANSVPATCFPPAAGLGQSWNTALFKEVGVALGNECLAENVSVLLGPGVNIRRSPFGGRNFEYFSEDPVLSAALGTAWVQGVESRGVGTSLKHFALNEQETDRFRVSAEVDERTMREVYLRAFQRVVTEAKPGTVMAAYNQINGVTATENSWLLEDVLRKEWGFEGLVVSDWGAVADRVAAAKAGLDLQMPYAGESSDKSLVDAVISGEMDEAVLERMADRVTEMVAKYPGTAKKRINIDAHHRLAGKAAEQSIVLLQNVGDVLPLSKPKAGEKLAVIGEFAIEPRYQGGGSSHVHATRVDIPFEEIAKIAGKTKTSFARGFDSLDESKNAQLRNEAVALAKISETTVLFLGLPEKLESEGYDRTSLALPDAQLALLKELQKVTKRLVLVLSHGGVIDVRPLLKVPAILDGALLGQAGGGAIARVLFGEVSPSGHLTETVPFRVEDTPVFPEFPGEYSKVRYNEGIFVGHRWYDIKDIDVAFPFGHGLSYTKFSYTDLQLKQTAKGISASVTVENVGENIARAVPQFYVGVLASKVKRPIRELKGFDSVELEPGKSKQVSVTLRAEDLQYWDSHEHKWILESADYEVWVGESSRDLRASAIISVKGDPAEHKISGNSTIAELLDTPNGEEVLGQLFNPEALGMSAEALDEMRKFILPLPIGRLVAFSGGAMPEEMLRGIIAAVNGEEVEIMEDQSVNSAGEYRYDLAKVKLGALLKDPEAVAILESYAEGITKHPMIKFAKNMEFEKILVMAGDQITPEIKAEVRQKLSELRAV